MFASHSGPSPARLTLLLVTLIPTVSSKVKLQWSIVDDQSQPHRPPALRGSLAAAIDGVMYVHGGWDGQSKVLHATTWSYDGSRWGVLQPTGSWEPPPRERHAGAVVGKHWYVYGGETTDLGPIQAFDVYDTETNEWRHVKTHGGAPPQLSKHSLTRVEHELVLFGGVMGWGKVNEELYILDCEGLEWEIPVTNGPKPPGRTSHAAAAVGHRLYIGGGSNSRLQEKPMSDIHMLDLKTRTWSPILGMGAPSVGLTAAVFGRQIVWFGGFDGFRPRSGLRVLDTSNHQLSSPEVKGDKPEGRCLHTAAKLGSRMIITGGVMQMDNSADYFGDTYVLEITRVADIDEEDFDNDDDIRPTVGWDDTDAKMAALYKKLHPGDEGKRVVRQAMEFEKQLTDAIGNQNRAMNVMKPALNKGKGYSKAPKLDGQFSGTSRPLAQDGAKMGTDPMAMMEKIERDKVESSQSAKDAFEQGMQNGLSLERALKEGVMNGGLERLRDPKKVAEIMSRPDMVASNAELKEAFKRFEEKARNDPSVIQSIDVALREAEEGLQSKADKDQEVLEKTKKILTDANGPHLQNQLDSLEKSDTAIQVEKEMFLARIAHMMRMLDSQATMNLFGQMIMSAAQKSGMAPSQGAAPSGTTPLPNTNPAFQVPWAMYLKPISQGGFGA